MLKRPKFPCAKCGEPHPAYRLSRSSGATAGFCLRCADEWRGNNPPGYLCRVCGERHTGDNMHRSRGERTDVCLGCFSGSPRSAKRVLQSKPAALPPSKLVEFRHRYGMTQSGFAAAMGVSVPAVSSWETGKTKIPPSLQLAMSAFIAGLPPYNG
jgi:DNA-binding XRE family transcriptional regulator